MNSTYRPTYSACPHDEPKCLHSKRGECIARQAKERKRVRTVVSSGEVPHLWYHKVQYAAKTSHGNLFFEGDTIYSYGRHFPIARHIQNKKKQSAVLFNSVRYSITTSGHQSGVRCAIPQGVLVFTVPNMEEPTAPSHAENIEYYKKQIAESMAKAARAKSNRDWMFRDAKRLREEAAKYIAFFGLSLAKAKLPAVNASELAKLLPKLRAQSAADAKQTKLDEKIRRITAYSYIDMWRDGDNIVHTWAFEKVLQSLPLETREAYEAEHLANVSAWQAKRDEHIIAENAVKIAQWRNGQDVSIPRDVPVMLRVISDGTGAETQEVETSMGARVPVSHAIRAIQLIRAVVKRGEDWKANGHTCHVGHYAIETISKEGTVKAGCHVIAFAEVEHIAALLSV